MLFTKSICDQFWRSYCKKSIFVIFHYLKFLLKCLPVQCTRVYISLALCIIDPYAFSEFSWDELLNHANIIETIEKFSDLISQVKKVALLQFRRCCMNLWCLTTISFLPPWHCNNSRVLIKYTYCQNCSKSTYLNDKNNATK